MSYIVTDYRTDIHGDLNAGLTHWGRVTHICVGKLTIIGSNNGLSPGRRQAIIWTNAGILLIGPMGTNFGEILITIETFSSKKMHLKISSAKWRPFCLGLNVLTDEDVWMYLLDINFCRFILMLAVNFLVTISETCISHQDQINDPDSWDLIYISFYCHDLWKI